MSGLKVNTLSIQRNEITDTQQKSTLGSFGKEYIKDLSKYFNQINTTGYDFETGLDINGCTFEEVLKKYDSLPTCIKFIDTEQLTGGNITKGAS